MTTRWTRPLRPSLVPPPQHSQLQSTRVLHRRSSLQVSRDRSTSFRLLQQSWASSPLPPPVVPLHRHPRLATCRTQEMQTSNLTHLCSRMVSWTQARARSKAESGTSDTVSVNNCQMCIYNYTQTMLRDAQVQRRGRKATAE